MQYQATELSPQITQMANAIRALSMDAVQRANSGHPGMPMGMADMAAALWSSHLGGPRPLRRLKRPRLDAAVQLVASHGL
jgi:transketolase N-terminal domain/subunit